MSAKLLELLDEELGRRAEDHVRVAYPCRAQEGFCRWCNPTADVRLPEADRVANYMEYERRELVGRLLKLLDEGFVTPDDLRDHSDD
jgi:hypothetical protein